MESRRKLTSIAGAFAALLLCVVLAACGGQGTDASSGTASGNASSNSTTSTQSAAYTQKEVPIFREAATDETVTLRFYEQTPSIAYIGLADYYKLMLPQGSMDVERKDDGTYLFTSHTGADPSTNTGQGLGGTAVADPAAGTLTSPDLPAFTNMMTMVQEGMDNAYLDGMPYVRVARLEYDKDPQPVTLDFAKYGITMYADDADVYLPIQTISVIYSDFGYHYASYNGEKVYINSDNVYDNMNARDPEFSKPILSNRTRAQDLVDFSYGQLRFCVDYFNGVPARKAEMLSNHDIDATLDAMGEDGKAIKEGLLSTDLVDYIVAADVFGLAIGDGGHTAISYAKSASAVSEDSPVAEEYTARATDTNSTLGVLYTKLASEMAGKYRLGEARQAVRDAAYGDKTYIKKGDTAVIVFDAFASDEQGWRDYFAGKGERPNGTDLIAAGDAKGMRDTVAIVSDGLARAKEDPEVKNVVIDISNNGGGSLDVLEYIASVVCGREYHQWQNTLTGQVEREYFDVDRNLDGAFDEKDDAIDYSDLHFAVLTSQSSFSCGNLLPSVLADADIMVMGERSGGGGCAVGRCVTADGTGWQESTWRGKLLNNEGQEIDDGIPVDVDLLERTGSKTTEEGYPDYSGFYDIDLLSQVMNEYYGEGSLAEAA
ncbi:MAG: S41 family peptidase [Coriobacteriales bacterium]|nr:S41 family peptidase [Coriobacteriales bacterium]